jgi:hypothetical protein
VILSTIIKSFSSNVGDILDHTTVYGFAIKNLTNNTIPHTKTKKANKSKASAQKFLNFHLLNFIYQNI